MSKYTTELRYIIESGFDLGLSPTDYPIFDESYRVKLNDKILNHYFFHEIGFETPERFKHYLNHKMGEIMPYYNKLYESELLVLNPLEDFSRTSTTVLDKDATKISTKDDTTTMVKDETETTTLDKDETETTTMDKDGSDNTTINSNVSDIDSIGVNEKDVSYNVPMGSIGDITESGYADSVQKRDATNTNNKNYTEENTNNKNYSEESTNNKTLTEDVTNVKIIDDDTSIVLDSNSNDTLTEDTTTEFTESGNNTSKSELLMKYRETFIRIDEMIIKELKDLFMLVY